jgi:sec-independent protein translocase protein TatA
MINSIPSATLLFSMPGGSEWIFIVIIVLLLFGGKKIPDLMRGIGKGIREFKDAKDQVTSGIQEGMNEGAVKKEEIIVPVKA